MILYIDGCSFTSVLQADIVPDRFNNNFSTDLGKGCGILNLVFMCMIPKLAMEAFEDLIHRAELFRSMHHPLCSMIAIERFSTVDPYCRELHGGCFWVV